jgi:hypothetical protein
MLTGNSLLESLGGTPELDLVPEDPVDFAQPIEEVEEEDNYKLSNLEQKALALLGIGTNAEAVAAALGVTPGRISQLLSEKFFADKVSKLRYDNLQRHNQRDEKYNSLEDKLLDKLERAVPLMLRPETILKAVTVVNNAKRRGQDSTAGASTQKNITNIIVPKKIVQKFTTNINNQVIVAGEQKLVTIQSGELLSKVEKFQRERELIEHDSKDSNSGQES